ncbi:MAG: lysine 2,3-aminomutase, partial [Candidatus Omnitrophica bacterium]|nr:lysine 2,3-aminomutase [Candidatus Omnitrophota bacterium]
MAEANRRAEIWKGVKDEEWEDWQWQLKNRITGLDELKKVIQLTPEEEEGVKRKEGRLLMAIPPYFAELMDPEKPYCPIRRQAVPLSYEFYTSPFDMSDPCGEDSDSPVHGLVH